MPLDLLKPQLVWPALASPWRGLLLYPLLLGLLGPQAVPPLALPETRLELLLGP
jgi:hypothetical protein